jgi:PKD repeat protein
MPRARHAVLGLAGLLLIAASAAWAGTSTLQNPSVTFATPGSRDVTLQACNALGCSSVMKTVTLLDPKPAVSAASFAPLLPEAGQMVRLTAAGTGKPPLAFNWQALAGTSPVSNLTGTSVWWNTAGLSAGAYTLSLQIQNGAGTATALLPVTLAQASALDFYTTTPCRLYDSRLGLVPPQSGVAVPIQASGFCGIPAGARALAANITVIAPTGGGYVTLYPGNYPQPATSTVNFAVNGTRTNNAILPLATDGTGTLTALLAMTGTGSSADLTVDVSGYYLGN